MANHLNIRRLLNFTLFYLLSFTALAQNDKCLYRLSNNMGSDGTTVAFCLGTDGKIHQH
ncbi:MAG: hypothetical protein ACI35U_10815 [Marinilabiliaceae bacterium]|nr:hypothetical protein [Bacteroidales bacterium]MDY4521575.1 hypothetical protein [Bacteroidales bacterium]